jgi:hypothetical protein
MFNWLGIMCVGSLVPWWLVAAMWCGYGLKLCLSKQSGLDKCYR